MTKTYNEELNEAIAREENRDPISGTPGAGAYAVMVAAFDEHERACGFRVASSP